MFQFKIFKRILQIMASMTRQTVICILAIILKKKADSKASSVISLPYFLWDGTTLRACGEIVIIYLECEDRVTRKPKVAIHLVCLHCGCFLSFHSSL